MRYAEVELLPGPTGFHPADRELVEADGVERIAIHHSNQLDDGTIVLLYELHGDRDLAAAILDGHDDVLAYSLSAGDSHDGGGESHSGTHTLQSYIHIEPNETLAAVFELPQQHSLVIDTPIDCLPNGGIRVLVLGDQPAVTGAVNAFPDGIDAELVATGSYRPDGRTLYSKLTAKQQEILNAAVEAGYYEVPRETTHEELATELDLAPVTVGEHLRKIESRILAGILPS